MTARGGGPTPTYRTYPYRTAAGGTRRYPVPTYPLGIAERWHRNLPSPAKERNPGCTVPAPRARGRHALDESRHLVA
jgi:hypothetical protein